MFPFFFFFAKIIFYTRGGTTKKIVFFFLKGTKQRVDAGAARKRKTTKKKKNWKIFGGLLSCRKQGRNLHSQVIKKIYFYLCAKLAQFCLIKKKSKTLCSSTPGGFWKLNKKLPLFLLTCIIIT